MSEKDTSNSSKTDWDRIDRLTDDQINTDDIPPLQDSFFDRARLRIPEDMVPILVAVDPDVLKWFQSQGGDFKQRMTAALRMYVEAHRRAS